MSQEEFSEAEWDAVDRSASPSTGTGADAESEDGEQADSREDLEARLDLLAEENRRLRREYAHVRTTQYRRTALGLAAIGLVAVLGGILFPGSRPVLFVLGATGLFGGLLTYYLTPERFIPASVGERVYAAFASTGASLVADLGLSDVRVYVPHSEGARLYVPQRAAFDLPDAAELESTFVTPEDTRSRGIATTPTGARLFEEFETARTAPLEAELEPLAEQLTDALVEQFELVDSVRVEAAPDQGRVTFGVSGSTYGAVDRFDHPVASFLAVGVATGIDAPTTLSVAAGDDRTDYLLTVTRTDQNGADEE